MLAYANTPSYVKLRMGENSFQTLWDSDSSNYRSSYSWVKQLVKRKYAQLKKKKKLKTKNKKNFQNTKYIRTES